MARVFESMREGEVQVHTVRSRARSCGRGEDVCR